MSLFMLLPVFLFFLLLFILLRVLLHQNKNITRLKTQLAEQTLLLTTLQGREESNDQLIAEQENKIAMLENNLQQKEQQYSAQFKQINEQITSLNNKLEQLNSQQPEDKLYSRAFKLASLGADAQEIAQTCEIPLAEAEMLLAIHQTKT